MTAALNVQLRERFLQARVHGRYFFFAEIFFHRGLGAFDCCFGGAEVDLRRF